MEDRMNVHSKRVILFAIVAVAGFALFHPRPASAQQAGTYTGKTADGNFFQVIVAKETGTGKFELTGISLNVTATCKATGGIVFNSYGLGSNAQIVNHKATFESEGLSFWATGNVDFETVNKVTGKIKSLIAAFVPGNTEGATPTAAEFCVSASQSFSATFQTNPSPTSVPFADAVTYDSAGHSIVE
jgi:hypothetical protein